MIPAAFDYVRAGSVEEAVSALQQHGDDAKLLAGGHSLLPLMKLRLALPEVLVDVGRVDALKGVSDAGDQLAIGAGTTHHDVIHNALVREHCAVVSDVTSTVGDAQVRHRGTIGGSLAHGDPASDLPALMLALDATLVAQGPGGQREIPAAEFFVDYLQTALAPDEVLVEVRVPKLGSGWGHHYEKFNLVAQAWAVVGAVALVQRANGAIASARVGLVNVGPTPVRASGVESALTGVEPSGDAVAAAADNAADGISPSSDVHASAEFRTHLARILTKRAVSAAIV
ncbi:MAG: FAD binding domain-containing protein [Jiangellaceae bacterium]